MEILGLEIPSGVYQSDLYSMFVDKPNKEQQKELNKTYYMKDKSERLKKVRELLKNNDDAKANCYVSSPTLPNWQDYGFKSLEAFYKLQNKSMFLGNWLEVSNKRALEIEVYVQTLYKEADKLFEKSEYEAISYLIEQQFTEHKNIFDNAKSDYAFRFQYNNLIYDLLQKKINELASVPIDDIRKTLKTKKPLTWNSKKSSIGTLFGMLHNAKIIEGSKADIIRSLSAMFNNLSESTIKDNVNLKVNTNEDKCLYDKETEHKAKDWISYLKESTTTQK